jgi:hypothetical protein
VGKQLRKEGTIMAEGFADIESLSRPQLLTAAHEYMLSGFHTVKALGVTLAMRGDLEEPASTEVNIAQWMGASPVYTGRMRRVMGIEGDDVPAIMKALQLDVGFCHQYMDVGYRVTDPLHGEFWLLHCGALIDLEPLGEEQIFNMCHTIEDPTFDATALATNPRAQIRPIHRPPRAPANRHPHCHWTIVIDEANDPVGPIPITQQISKLPLASVPNAIVGTPGTGRGDYRGDFDPEFRLRDFSDPALAAAAREFQVQAHLLATSLEATISPRIGAERSRAILDEAWLGASWIAAERLPRVIGLGAGSEAVGTALRFTPMVPPGFDRDIAVDGDRITCTLTAVQDRLLDPGHLGWCGSLSRGATGLFEGTAGGLGYQASGTTVEVDGNTVQIELSVNRASSDRTEPDVVGLSRFGRTANWTFDLPEARS